MNTAIIIVTVIIALAVLGALFIAALLFELSASIFKGINEETDDTDEE